MHKPKLSFICGTAVLISIAALFGLSHKSSMQTDLVDSNRQPSSDQEKAPPPPPSPPTGDESSCFTGAEENSRRRDRGAAIKSETTTYKQGTDSNLSYRQLS